LEKHTVNGIPVRIRRLGDHRIEVITSDRKKELQRKLCNAIDGANYTGDVRHDTDSGNITCRLLTTVKMTFNKLIGKIVRLFVECVESYASSVASNSTSDKTSHRPGPKRRSRRYYKRHHISPEQNPVTT
jgi:hypothetical protein